ncbi:MAG: hypothetical protein FWG65_05940 [Turicibacter sp.]|nr:hypothetical protein [Turicibacter sp.]
MDYIKERGFINQKIRRLHGKICVAVRFNQKHKIEQLQAELNMARLQFSRFDDVGYKLDLQIIKHRRALQKETKRRDKHLGTFMENVARSMSRPKVVYSQGLLRKAA